jgi:hypothetical protein
LYYLRIIITNSSMKSASIKFSAGTGGSTCFKSG